MITGLLNDMTKDAIEFGQVFGNLGHAILNFAAAMPGLAELLLRVADGISRVILWASQYHVIITMFMVFEEFQRWGGLVSTMLGKMGLALGDTSGKWYTMAHAAGVFKSIFGLIPALITKTGSAITAAAPAFGYFAGDVYKAGTAMEDAGKAGSRPSPA